jgi:hypothetical protein
LPVQRFVAVESSDQPLAPFASQPPFRHLHRPAFLFHRFEHADARGTEWVAEEEAATGREVGVEDGSEKGLEPRGVDDVGAEDEIVALGVRPLRPVGKSVLDGADAITLGVQATDRERLLEAVGLDDARAVRRGDDAGQSGAGAELEDALAWQPGGARDELVREGDRSGPEREAVRRAAPVLAEVALLVLFAEDRARVRNRPGVAVEAKVVLVQRPVVRQRHRVASDDVWRGSHMRVAAARTIPSATSMMRVRPGTSMRDATSVAR